MPFTKKLICDAESNFPISKEHQILKKESYGTNCNVDLLVSDVMPQMFTHFKNCFAIFVACHFKDIFCLFIACNQDIVGMVCYVIFVLPVCFVKSIVTDFSYRCCNLEAHNRRCRYVRNKYDLDCHRH